jgi:hypothetical protein
MGVGGGELGLCVFVRCLIDIVVHLRGKQIIEFNQNQIGS